MTDGAKEGVVSLVPAHSGDGEGRPAFTYLENKNLHSDVVMFHALHQAEHTGIVAHHGVETSLEEEKREERY